MLASIIVLTYKNFEFLDRNIKSIFNQNYRKIEIVIQDDATENFDVEKIRDKYSIRPSNIVNMVVSKNEVNLGTVKNYNKAISIAKGEIIIPLSCDDAFYDESVVSDIVEYFNNNSCGVCTAYRKGNNRKIVYPMDTDVELLKSANREKLLHRLYVSNFISGATLYWRRDFLNSMQGFDERYRLVEDYPMVLKLVESGKKIGFLERIAISNNETGISNRKATLFKKNKIADNDAKLIKDMYVMPELENIGDRRLRRLIKACYYLKFSKNKTEFFLRFCNYLDIWGLVVLTYFRDKKIRKVPFDVYHIIKS